MKKITVAVIYGGVSGEHEVSLLSAASVIAALNPTKYDVLPVKIGKDGVWKTDASLLPPAQRAAVEAGQRSLAPTSGANRLVRKDGKAAEKIDVAFPLVHGTTGEDGCLQGLFELAGIPYVGSGVLGSAIGMDKILQKNIFEREGFPIAAYETASIHEWRTHKDDIIERIENHLQYPCFVKPANLGSSVGISKAHHRKELLKAIPLALSYDRRIVIEAAVPDAREIECAVLGNEEPRPSVLGEIIPSNEFYDYAAKYLDGKSQTIIDAALPPKVTLKIKTLACKAFLALDAAGLARVDFFVRRDTGDVYLNEINTLPGFTAISMYPKLWEASGIAYGELLDELVLLALERGAEKTLLKRSFDVPAGTRGRKRR